MAKSPIYREAQARLRDFITEAGLGPGDRLPPESALAERLGVSRLSLREATRSLQTLGVIEARHGNGLFVSAFSFRPLIEQLPYGLAATGTALEEILTAREAMEVGLMPAVARLNPQVELAECARLADEMTALEGRGKPITEVDKRFHLLALPGTGQPARRQPHRGVLGAVHAARRLDPGTAGGRARGRAPADHPGPAGRRRRREHRGDAAALRRHPGARRLAAGAGVGRGLTVGPLTASDLRGVWATVLLPVRDDESIDFDRLAVALDHVLASGVHGVYTNGTAGEFHTLTDAEYDRLHALVAERCTSGRRAVPARGEPSQRPAVPRTGSPAPPRLRPGAIQVVLPDWLPLVRGRGARRRRADGRRRRRGAAGAVQPAVREDAGRPRAVREARRRGTGAGRGEGPRRRRRLVRADGRRGGWAARGVRRRATPSPPDTPAAPRARTPTWPASAPPAPPAGTRRSPRTCPPRWRSSSGCAVSSTPTSARWPAPASATRRWTRRWPRSAAGPRSAPASAGRTARCPRSRSPPCAPPPRRPSRSCSLPAPAAYPQVEVAPALRERRIAPDLAAPIMRGP